MDYESSPAAPPQHVAGDSLPRSGPYAAGVLSMGIAQGNLREALGGLRNLAQLLQSLRVAPKSVSAVLPDVYMSFSSLRRALEQLFETLRPLLVRTSSIEQLSKFVAPRLDHLEAELRVAMGGPVTAKSRLRLEQTVLRACAELDSARSLLDLLIEATTRPALDVSLKDLIQQTFWIPNPNRALATRTITVRVTQCVSPVELRVNPRVLSHLCTLGVELVSSAPGSGDPHIQIGMRGRDAVLLIDREGSLKTDTVLLAPHGLIDPTLSCLEAAAELSNARLLWVPQKSRFSVEWSTAVARISEAS